MFINLFTINYSSQTLNDFVGFPKKDYINVEMTMTCHGINMQKLIVMVIKM